MSIVAGDIVINLSLDDSDMKVRIKDASSTLKTFDSTLQSTARSVKNLENNQESLSTKFRHLVITMGELRFVAMDINDVFLRLPMSILKTAGELERLQILMTGLSDKIGDAAKKADGQSMFDYILKTAQQVPFSVKSISDAFVKFKTAGLDPTDGSARTLLETIAKFGGNSQTIEHAALAIQQMAGKGVISMEELRRQLGEAIPTAMRNMADGMGLSMQELGNKVKAGVVVAQGAIDKMLLNMKINNQGAAKAMMESWSGMLSQLQTQWELAAKNIADDGFADGAKQVVKELQDSLKSDEFRRFALTFGTALGEVATDLKKTADFAIAHGEAITNLIVAYAALKLNFGLLLPAGLKLRDLLGQMGDGWKQSMANAQKAADAEKAAMIQRNQQILAGLETEAATAAKQIEIKRAMIASIESQAEQHANRMAVINAKANALGPANGSALTDPNFAQRAKLATAMATETEAYKAQRAAAALTAAEVANLQTQQLRLSTASEQTSRAIRTLEGTHVQATVASRALAAATTALGFAFNAVGGWIGLITTLVTVGALAWAKWGHAAEDAAMRAKRAAKGLSDADDVSKAIEYENDKRADYLAAKRETSNSEVIESETSRQKSAEEHKKDLLAEAKALQDWKDSQATTLAAKMSVSKSNARDFSETITQGVTTVNEQVDSSVATELAKSREAQNKRLAGLKVNTKEYQDAYNAATTEQVNIYLNGQKAKLKGLEAARAQMDKYVTTGSGTPEQLNAYKAAAKSFSEQITSINAELSKDIKTKDAPNDFGAGKPKGEPKPLSKFDALLAQLASQRVELDAELASYKDGLGVIDKAAAEGAKLKAKINSGLYNEGGKKPVKVTPEQANAAAQTLTDNERLKEAMQVATEITKKGEEIGPGYAQAVEMLANPLGDTKSASLQAFDKMLAGITNNRKQVMEALGVTETQFDEKVKEIRAKNATIDIAKPYADMVAENQRLGNELILNDHDRTEAQLAFDNELFTTRMQHRIDEAKTAGVSADQIEKIEQTLAQNQILRAQTTAQKLRSPLQVMLDQWKDVTQAMDAATAQWASSTVDAFVQTAVTGKQQFSSLVISILSDFAKIAIQKQAGGVIGALADGAGSWLKGLLGGGSSGGSLGAGGLTDMGSSTVGMTFAKGGIGSQFGSLPLRRYAAGGIQKAGSPALALYGEGSMNEAFVPLPDGRSIPVSGAGTNVLVNVINQTQQPVQASQGSPRFDGKQMVLDVVLTAVSTPGPFRDGMASALK